MWHMIAMGVLAYLALRWFDAAADAEAELRRRDEADRPQPRDTIDSPRVILDAEGQYKIID